MTLLNVRRRVPRWGQRYVRRPARFKGAKGGRSSGKSHFFAEEFVDYMVNNPDARMVCIREVQRSLKFSAKSLIEAKIIEMGVGALFEVLTTEIRRKHGRGVAIFEGMQDHTADSIKSLEGFAIAWIEEAQSISQRSLELLIPTIRAEGSELWFTWNPYLRSDPVEELFASLREDFMLTHVTYLDNPWCPSTMKIEANRLKALDPELYEHIWMGGFYFGGNGRVYAKFSAHAFPLGNVDESVTDHGGDLFIGQDFNVNPMSSVIGVRVVDEFHVIRALSLSISSTTEVVDEVKTLYPKRRVIFCPDPAGNARSTKTTVVGQTDFTILRAAGFEVRAPKAHPPVVDRINNANLMFFDGERRRVRVHPDARDYITALQYQTYKEGTSQPDKKGGFDHMCDAGDYALWQEFNVLRANTITTLRQSA